MFRPVPKPVGKRRRERARLPEKTGRCEVCGSWGEETHWHHISFRSQGGTDEADNLIEVCWRCHGQIHSGRISRREIELCKAQGRPLKGEGYVE